VISVVKSAFAKINTSTNAQEKRGLSTQQLDSDHECRIGGRSTRVINQV